MKLGQAVKELTEMYPEAVSAFYALYSILGNDELYDGIYTAMDDEGYGEFMETLLDYIDETAV